MSYHETLSHGPEPNQPEELFQQLEKVLTETPSTRSREMIELLIEMQRNDALAFRWDTSQGFPIAVWYPLNPNRYADWIFPMEDDFSALLAERFLIGQIEFSIRAAPSLAIEWHEKGRGERSVTRTM